MSDSADDEIQTLIHGLRQGDEVAIQAFVQRYGRSLERIADNNIATQMGRRFGADDVVQSVCRTFVRRAQQGEFKLDGSEALWRLLCAITLTKVRESARYHLRQKRSIAGEANLSNRDDDSDRSEDELGAGSSPAPEALAEFSDTFEALLGELDDEERQVIDMKLQQLENDQIAAELGCSERTVRRLLSRLQERFESWFSED